MYLNKSIHHKNKLLRECKASWWVVAFILFTYMLSVKTSNHKEEKITQLAQQLKTLNEGKVLALLTKERLALEIESQQDPFWMEMVLIKKLGLIPKGHTKIRFKKEQDSHDGL